MQRIRSSLDGRWEFITDPASTFSVNQLDNEPAFAVTVPAPWQTQSSELRHYSGTAWYRRSIEIPAEWTADLDNQTIILGFGAVDYFAEVWLNGTPVGHHEGGYLPFEIDIHRAVKAGENQLIVRVSDPAEIFDEVPHGKQSWYGLLSGIWQSVWIESRPMVHIDKVFATPRVSEGNVQVEVRLNRAPVREETMYALLLAPDGKTASQTSLPVSEQMARFSLPVHDPLLWELDSPSLYTLQVSLQGEQMDRISETVGFRTMETRDGKLWLNDRPIFLRGALDQDYYPELAYTPPSIEFIEDQFREAKAMGLNCLRTHIKIADPRYYAAADRVGLLIWTELPNWQTLTAETRRRVKETLVGMVERDWNHPSIVIWTIVNESWGLDLTDPSQRAWLVEMYDFLKALDPYRLVVGNSACEQNFQVVTDVEDFHIYYSIPDHYQKWKKWVRSFANRPAWAYAHVYQDFARWRSFRNHPWKKHDFIMAPEVRQTRAEPLVVSEFGNWGLPDIQKLYQHYGGEPWWFHTGLEWGEGAVYPHGIEDRFWLFHLNRVFHSLADLTNASQQHQSEALKFEIEQIRRQDSLSGYVITEFTDVHWECNGLLDMCRNPKTVAHEICNLNSEDVIIPDWQRLSYWEGELCRLDIYLSHYSSQDLQGSRIEWQLLTYPTVRGVLNVRQPRAAGVSHAGRIEFCAPSLSRHTNVQLQLRLLRGDGTLVAVNTQNLFFFARLRKPERDTRIHAPELADFLVSLGYSLVPELSRADIAITFTLDDCLREFLLHGGRVLWLAESDHSLQTNVGALKLKPRRETVWRGDWASNLSWICQDRLFSGLPTSGLLNFAFAGLTPEHVIHQLKPTDFARRVHAGLAVGWLNKVSAVVAELKVGEGTLLISTFQLSRQLGRHPMADVLLEQMLTGLLNRTDN